MGDYREDSRVAANLVPFLGLSGAALCLFSDFEYSLLGAMGLLALTALLMALGLKIDLFGALVVFAPVMFFLPGLYLHLAVSDAILVFMAVSMISRVKFSKSIRIDTNLALYALGALTLIFLSALAASLGPNGIFADLAATNFIKLVVTIAYLVVVSVHVARAPLESTFRTLRLWAWTAATMSLGSVVWALGGPGLVPHDAVRSNGFFQDPNLYAGYLLVSLAVIILCEAFKHARETPLLLIIVCGGIVSTASRGAIGTIVVLLLFGALFVRLPVVRFALAAIGLIGAWVGSQFVGGSSSSALPTLNRLTTSSQQVGDDPRLLLWARALELWEQHPLLGVGLGQFGRYTIDISGYAGPSVGYIAHNTFLSFLAETGILGFVLVTGGFLKILQLARKESSPSRTIRAALTLGVLAVFLQMLTLNLQNVRYVWIFFGFVVGLSRIPAEQWRDRASLPQPKEVDTVGS